MEMFGQALGVLLLPSITERKQTLHPLRPSSLHVPAAPALDPAIGPTSPSAPGFGNVRKVLGPASREGRINPIIFICLQIFICSLAEMISRSLSGLLSCYFIWDFKYVHEHFKSMFKMSAQSNLSTSTISIQDGCNTDPHLALCWDLRLNSSGLTSEYWCFIFPLFP